MKALSIKQPWAWLICAGYKDVECRSWPTKYRGRIYIHAGKRFDYESWCNMLSGLVPGASSCQLTLSERFHGHNGDSLLGAIIGEADIVDCKYRFGDENDNLYSKWHSRGQYGFILANPVLYGNPIPCKGRLGFFEPDILENRPQAKEKILDITT